MKAVRLSEYGGPLVFNDVPNPTIARDEILVKIKTTAVTRAGTGLRWTLTSGAIRWIYRHTNLSPRKNVRCLHTTMTTEAEMQRQTRFAATRVSLASQTTCIGLQPNVPRES